MIEHLVVFSFRAGISWDDPRSRAAELLTLEHPKNIPEIVTWFAGRNVTPRPDAGDFAVAGLFLDRAALQRYLVHPHHQLGVRAWRELATWAVVDLQVEADTVHRHGARLLSRRSGEQLPDGARP